MGRSSSRLVVVVASLVASGALAGCFPPPPVYRVQRSARVFHPTVPLRTGQALTGPVELSFGASNVGDTQKPRPGDAGAGIEVPRHQVRGELRMRVGVNGEVAAIHERSIGSRMYKLDDTQAEIEDGAAIGSGGSLRYAVVSADRKLALGLDLEVMLWQLPYVEHRTCVENCPEYEPTSTVEHDRASQATVGFGLTPSYRDGRWTVFGGVFARNHPTIDRKGTELTTENDEDLEGGRRNVLVHAGFAVRLGPVSALVLVNQNLTQDPVHYGPGVGLALSATLP
ncbi:MAG: hypothetical protein H0T89_20115 [Deltaproteobacteria bacterium]|nr:hypothetical protein [Deltaproteobacteria bacterium]MDQ3296382.1 hypothetical protein [Myxococcota bacterium]